MNISLISLITLKFWTLLHHESCHVERNITLKLRNNVWSYCYAELRAAMRKPFRNLMTARRQDGKVQGFGGVIGANEAKWKKNAERLSNSLSGNYPTTSRQWLLQKLDLVILHHLMTHMISLSYPWECSQKLCVTHRFFQILHKSIKKFGCSFKMLIHIFSPPSRPIRHLLTSSCSDELLHLPEAMSCSVPPQGASEEEAAIVGSPIVEAQEEQPGGV